jgi:hypothetical protein
MLNLRSPQKEGPKKYFRTFLAKLTLMYYTMNCLISSQNLSQSSE